MGPALCCPQLELTYHKLANTKGVHVSEKVCGLCDCRGLFYVHITRFRGFTVGWRRTVCTRTAYLRVRNTVSRLYCWLNVYCLHPNESLLLAPTTHWSKTGAGCCGRKCVKIVRSYNVAFNCWTRPKVEPDEPVIHTATVILLNKRLSLKKKHVIAIGSLWQLFEVTTWLSTVERYRKSSQTSQ